MLGATMAKSLTPPGRQAHRLPYRGLLAGAGLMALSTTVALEHRSADEGLAAEDITPQAVMSMASELGIDATKSGAWLVDFVEPADGEGGSEEEIARLVAELEVRLGPGSIAPMGFYSEGEHLFRMEGTLRSASELLEHPLVEGVEPEMFYALPEQAASAFEGPLPADWRGELEKRGIRVSTDLLRDHARDVLRDYGESGLVY